MLIFIRIPVSYKHIIFDIDGTLLDTEFAVLHGLQDTAKRFLNKCIPTDKLVFALGLPGEVTLATLGAEDSPKPKPNQEPLLTYKKMMLVRKK